MMGTPLRKSRIAANDVQRPIMQPVVVPPVPLPLPARPVPRAIPYVRLAPTPPPQNFSWIIAFAVILLGVTIFLLGAVAGTVFWFTYDSQIMVEPVSSSLEMARLEKPPTETVRPSLAPFPETPADIVLPVQDDASSMANTTAPTSASLPATSPVGDMQLVVHDRGSMDIDILLQKARTFLERNQNDVALVLYERVLVQEPENRAALEGKAFALGTISLPAALKELQRMAKVMPDDAVMQEALARAMAQRGEISEAITHLDRAVRLNPGDIAARFNLAVLYDRAGQVPRALAIYTQIVQMAQNDDAVLLPPDTVEAVRRRADYLGMIGKRQ